MLTQLDDMDRIERAAERLANSADLAAIAADVHRLRQLADRTVEFTTLIVRVVFPLWLIWTVIGWIWR